MRALLHKIAIALAAYGPWGVFLLALIDSMGVPLPAAMDAMVIGVAAASAKTTQSHAWLAALMASLGSVAGNIFLFQAARHGRRIIRRGEAAPGKSRRFEQWFQRYGLVSVFVPAVIPVVPLPLKVFVISAGAFHSPFSRFAAVIVVARLIRYFGLAWLGIQLGEDAEGFLVRNGWTLGVLALVMAFALYLLIRLNDRRQLRGEPAQRLESR